MERSSCPEGGSSRGREQRNAEQGSWPGPVTQALWGVKPQQGGPWAGSGLGACCAGEGCPHLLQRVIPELPLSTVGTSTALGTAGKGSA